MMDCSKIDKIVMCVVLYSYSCKEEERFRPWREVGQSTKEGGQ